MANAIGTRIQEIRKNAGLNQEEFANSIGITQGCGSEGHGFEPRWPPS